MLERIRFYAELAGLTLEGFGVAVVVLSAFVAFAAAAVLYFNAAGL